MIRSAFKQEFLLGIFTGLVIWVLAQELSKYEKHFQVKSKEVLLSS